MPKTISYRCSFCGQEFEERDTQYTCSIDNGNLDIILDYDEIREKFDQKKLTGSNVFSIWRYLPLLPVDKPSTQTSPLNAVGWTPVFDARRLGKGHNLSQLWIKDDSRNPTGSFKDRASAVVVTRAGEIKADRIVTASTGNAGAALAGMAAAADQKAVIFAPRTAPPAKIAQLLVYNAMVFLVDGSYDDAFDLTIKAADEFGWYCRNTGYNPFTAEGKKTAAYEIWEWSLGEKSWHSSQNETPAIFVSVGDGNIISGIYKGYKDLAKLGWIDSPPRLFGVQAEGSAAVANAFLERSEKITPVSADTIADSISVDLPRDGMRALRAVRETNGMYIKVSDAEILSAIKELGEIGIFAEPAGAASYAGVIKAARIGLINHDTPILAINTGNGLKDIKAVVQSVEDAKIIEPTLEALQRVLD
jgi:threonine synthase